MTQVVERTVVDVRQEADALGVRRGGRRPRKSPPVMVMDDAGVPTILEISEDNLAHAFARHFRDKLRFDHTSGKWFVWNDVRWQRNETRKASDWVRRFVGQMNADGQAKWAKAAVFAAVETIASRDQTLAVTLDIFDRDPWLLGTPGGIVNLRDGSLSKPNPAKMISKSTAVVPAAPGTVPIRWVEFLQEATRHDAGLVRFLQQVLGYSLTGLTIEQILLFVYGPGGNGKGVFLNTTTRLLGDYAQTADMRTFTASKHDRHSTELAALAGARLVTAVETERDQALAESRLKQLTGGDPIRARFMRCDEFEFMPQFQLVMVGNYKPRIRAVDQAWRRRLNLVNFMHQPTHVNPHLSEQLMAEGPAILRWMIDGCLDWQANGLIRPQSVIDATAEYFSEQDLFASWLSERCNTGTQLAGGATALYQSWSEFARAAGEDAGTQTAFGAELDRRGYAKERGMAGVRRRGLALKPSPEHA